MENNFLKTVKKILKEPHFEKGGEPVFYSGAEVLKEDFDILYTHGGRNTGKSTWWKRLVFLQCWESMKDNPQKANRQFVLLRRHDLETRKSLADNYWRDFDVKKLTGGVYDDIEVVPRVSAFRVMWISMQYLPCALPSLPCPVE